MNRTDLGDANPVGVVSLRWVRAGDSGEAREVETETILAGRQVDTGEVGHVAGGRVLAVLTNHRNTVNGAIQEAAVELLEISELEGDDGTGGVDTLERFDRAIRLLQEARLNLE